MARNFIVDEKPDVVVDIIDTSNLERNLYLAVQLMETGIPLVFAFNMSDEARARGYEFDIERFSQFFNAPVVKTVGHKGEGIDELTEKIVAVASLREGSHDKPVVNYGAEVEEEIKKIMPMLEQHFPMTDRYGWRWLALKLLENDRDIRDKVNSGEINGQVEKSAARIEKMLGEHPENGHCRQQVRVHLGRVPGGRAFNYRYTPYTIGQDRFRYNEPRPRYLDPLVGNDHLPGAAG